MLGQKQRTDQADWLRIKNNIHKNYPKNKLDNLLDRTVEEIKIKCKNKRVAISWSGGKDSLVLNDVMNLAGIEEAVFAMCNLEYPAFLQWVTDHMPFELTVINTGQDLNWLRKNPEMLFPQDSKTAGKWFKMIQHRAQKQYYLDRNLDIIALGRRRKDGNFVGRNGENIYTNAKGITRYSPIADWTHEDCFAFIHYYDVPLPPIYDWPSGYKVGTGPWAARQWTGSLVNGWREVYSIDKNIVLEAAKYFRSGRQFLEMEGIL